MVEKRFYKKMAGLIKEIVPPTAVNVEGADLVLMGFGSTYGVMNEVSAAVPDLRIGFVHLSQVWPFPARDIHRLLEGVKKLFTVENNAGGQLAKLLLRETGISVQGSVLRYDGRPFDLDFLQQALLTTGIK
jgi:2-oxoglutarate ferredoxin oxidoreductase subunit alpha